MLTRSCAALLCLPALVAPPQQPARAAGPAPSALVERTRAIFAEALEHGQAHALLSELCRVAPKRLAGSIGAAAAAEWGRQALERAGCVNVRLEPCQVPHWERGAPERLAICAPAAFAGERLACLALGPSIATPPEGLRAEVVEFDGLGDLRERGALAKGKIAFLNQPMPAGELDTFKAYGLAVGQRWAGAAEAAKFGAVAVLVRSMTLRIDDHPHTGSMGYQEGVTRIPAAAVSTQAAERLALLLRAGQKLELQLVMQCVDRGETTGYNVIGELSGRGKPAEVLVVGGHLDAWDAGDGAHDDGAGCAQSIEALWLLKRAQLAPRRTLRCVLFANEENGARGGRAYYAAHEAELAQHVLALESDRGGLLPRGFEGNLAPAAREQLAPALAALASFGIERWEPGDGGVDIGPMQRAGVPLMGLLPDSARYFDYHHAATDTIEAVNPRELELGAAAMAALLYEAAELEEPLARNAPAPER